MTTQLIVFGEDWAGLPSSTQHIISQLAPDYSVIWINSLGLRSPKANRHDFKRLWNKAWRMARQWLVDNRHKHQPSHAESVPTADFNVVEPQYLPILGSQLVRRLNRFLLYRLLKRHVHADMEGQQSVIWISLPNAVDALYYIEKTGLVDPLVIYYCCDDFAALDGVDHQAVTKFEQELAQQAGLIITTSEQLEAKFPPQKTHMIPHGVDIELFSAPTARAADLPVGKPMAGFYGSIAPWIDIRLIRDVALMMEDWNFILIGTPGVDISMLAALNNVFLLGAKPHHELPRYSQHWDVSLLPFILNEQVIASNPLKLREYMAAGKPIVSIDFPQIQQYRQFIEVADGAQAFAAAIRRCYRQSEQVCIKRRQKVAEQSWQAIAGRIHDLIGRLK